MANTFLAPTPPTQKSMGYDHPSYLTRQSVALGALTGAAGVTTKFVAFANMAIFAVNITCTVTGTTTLQNTVTGTATATVSSALFNFIRITNTGGTGAPAASTSTIGPFYVGGTFASGGTGTAGVGGFNQYNINTVTGTNPYGTGYYGGLSINAGDIVYLVNGTDATVSSVASLDYQVQPLANVVA